LAPDASTVRHMQDLLEGWGEEVRRLLADQGISISELARRVSVEPSTISRIVNGKLNPNDELKWKIAGALGERMDVLWAWPRVIPPSPVRAAS
jgi:transcriptional regulator with XRE-family HTH domain